MHPFPLPNTGSLASSKSLSANGFRSMIVAQFHRPTGMWGDLAGWIMATRPSNRARNRWTVDLLDLRSTDHVLEIGFGPGLALEALAARVARGSVCGIDHSDRMLAMARRRLDRSPSGRRVELRLGTMDDLHRFERRFDRVIAVNVAQFWSEPAVRLELVRQVMRPGGTLALTVQPRGRAATAATSQRAAEVLVEAVTRARFTAPRVARLPLRPVPAVCVLATA